MSVELEPIRPDFDRDRWGRPLILQPDGSRIAYTRATTFVGAPEDLWNVHKWEKRQVALGLSARPDYVLDVQAHRDDKNALNAICDRAKEAAGASAAATRGTAVHSFTELIDLGRELPPGIDAETMKCLDAYREAMRPFKIPRIGSGRAGVPGVPGVEVRLVQDQIKVAGTADRVIDYRGNRYIADLKTGSTVELGTGKIAGQLAMYARSRPYDVSAEERLDHHRCSAEWGLIVHLPADRPGEISLIWVDLVKGWEWCRVAREVREQRSIRFKQWAKPFDPDARPEPTATQRKAESKAARAALEHVNEREAVARMIRASDTRALVEQIWRANADIWNDELTEVAKQRIAEIERKSA